MKTLYITTQSNVVLETISCHPVIKLANFKDTVVPVILDSPEILI